MKFNTVTTNYNSSSLVNTKSLNEVIQLRSKDMIQRQQGTYNNKLRANIKNSF